MVCLVHSVLRIVPQFATIVQYIDDFRAIYIILVKSNKDARGTANSVLYAHAMTLTDRNVGEFVLKYNSTMDISSTHLPQLVTATECAELEAISRQIFGLQFLNLCMQDDEASQLSFLGQK